MFTSACKNNQEENLVPDLDNMEVSNPPDPTQAVQLSGDFDYSLEVNGSESYEISNLLYGLFLEDINFAADGGLYAELLKNRSFEYGSLAMRGSLHGWVATDNITFDIMDGSTDKSYLNENNPQYARVANPSSTLGGIGNFGFLDGLSVTKDADYNFSGYFKSSTGYHGAITLQLKGNDGTIYGESTITEIGSAWTKYKSTITASATISEGLKLFVLINEGSVDMDMISLFPEDTYQGRENGLRKDLAQALEDLSPKFLRFPGGCVVEGETLENAYSWKASIGNGLAFTINGEVTYGDVATRPQGENLWGDQNNATTHPYYMSYGLGFYEYFLLCEDIKAAPVPIVNAGLSCLIQGTRSVGIPAQAAEIGTPEFEQYVQDALDLVEFCKGDENTKWGAIRIAMGHKEPFDLTYLGIGNEQWSNDYYNRYEEFKKAFDQAKVDNPELYGDIELIVANGPTSSDQFAWNKINSLGTDYAGLVDEHYYNVPSWFLTNTNRYDTYDRSSTPVFLGEYAAKSNNTEAALAEAAYMTGLERNGDIVKLASYAPLFGNSTSYQWSPDMIWFQNDLLWKSANYYVQQLFSTNQSKQVIKSELSKTSSSETESSISGKVGIGTWMTSATFDDIMIISNETNEVLYSDDFSTDSIDSFTKIAGTWVYKDGQMLQTNTSNPRNTITGDVSFVGDTNWTNYTLTMTATKLSGSEGFLIPFAVKDENNYYHWNIGGWNNTVSCLEQISGGSKSGQIASTVTNLKVETGKSYEIKIVVNENSIECYLDGKGLIKYTLPKVDAVYQVVGVDDTGDMIIKIVNVSDTQQNILVQLNDISLASETAVLSVLAANDAGDMNTPTDPEKVAIIDSTIIINNSFSYSAPKYSVSVIRVPINK
jgi:alpha-L-arabinofuranosidase